MRIRRSFFLLFLLLAAGVTAIAAAKGWPPATGAAVIALLGVVLWLTGDTAEMTQAPEASADTDGQLPQGFGRALLEQMPAALIVVAQNERLTYVNAAARTLFPTARQGAHFSTLIRAPKFVDALDHILANREERQFTFDQSAPKARIFEARATFLPSHIGREFGDVDQVIIQIEDRTRDKALLDMRTDFIANASHELRTPLSSILGYIETLQGHAKDDPAAQELFLDIMMKQATRMKRLVDDLMSLSRIEMNAHVRPETVVDFHRVVAEASAALFPLASQSDVLLQVDLPGNGVGPQVRGDRDQLNQVVVNLIDNAIKYGGRGKKVRVTPADPDPRHPGMVGISIADEGPGIPRDHIPRLTERFYRVNTAQSKDKGGTGLGLAITKHIMARHEGALDIRSTVGIGSTFTLWLPEAHPLDNGETENRPAISKG